MKEQSALLEQVETLREAITHRDEQITSLTELLTARQAQIGRMQAQLNDLLKRLYGRKSEKLDPKQFLMQELLEAAESVKPAADSVAAGASAQTGAITVAGYRRRERKPLELPEQLQRVEHLHDVAPEDKICGCCRQELFRIGEDVTEKLDYQPVRLRVNRHIRPKYACKNPECGGGSVQQQPAPVGPLGRCEAESSLLAHIIVEKFEHHSPLYRQELRFNRMGVGLSRMTLCG